MSALEDSSYPLSWDSDEPRFMRINKEEMDKCACGTWKHMTKEDCGYFCKLNIKKRLGK